MKNKFFCIVLVNINTRRKLYKHKICIVNVLYYELQYISNDYSPDLNRMSKTVIFEMIIIRYRHIRLW